MGRTSTLKKRITQFVASDDPLGAAALVKLGLDRGEIRTDVDPFLITSFLECTFERMHDFLLTAEADPELFHRASDSNGNKERMIDHFITVLRGAIGTPQALNPSATCLLSWPPVSNLGPMDLSLREILLSYDDRRPLEKPALFPLHGMWMNGSRCWSGSVCSGGPGKWWRGSTSCSVLVNL